ncbi:hypothetical protein BD626DRAFT_411239 [Schizophyllum amplum]|uniref:Integrase core domain-containing protein n=1 Tax=Schizophyllum amplum TaxID=97359 RepID=A0A550BZ82_9AGAR|nr:hypothetical protein BD626DRAFT_411239 [Auriculariopsis ampla]
MDSEAQPEAKFEELVTQFFKAGKTDTWIAEHVLEYFDKGVYGCSAKTIQRTRARLQLKSTRQQKATFDSIADIHAEIRKKFPTVGARQMRAIMAHDYNLKVPELLIQMFQKEVEPDLVRARKSKRFRRKQYVGAGVMDCWTMDQHDKWRRFKLYLHVGLDPVPGQLLWLRIWWTNRNPRLIARFYLDAARSRGGVPLLSQSDPGTENNGVANCHTNIRQALDPTLVGTLQHQWRRNKTNVKPEAFWSFLRRYFTPGFEDVLEYGLVEDLYNPEDPVHELVFRWIFIPWLQDELDAFMKRFNATPRRTSKHKLLPQGDSPDVIAAMPHLHHKKSFIVGVPPAMFDDAESKWAPPDDKVFQLVPPDFAEQATILCRMLQLPPTTIDNAWVNFKLLLDAVRRTSSSSSLLLRLRLN